MDILATTIGLALLSWLGWFCFGYVPHLDKNPVECRYKASLYWRKLDQMGGYSGHSLRLQVLRTMEPEVFALMLRQALQQVGFCQPKRPQPLEPHTLYWFMNDPAGMPYLIAYSQFKGHCPIPALDAFVHACETKGVKGLYCNLGFISVPTSQQYRQRGIVILSGLRLLRLLYEDRALHLPANERQYA